jgi:hypothetical protein
MSLGSTTNVTFAAGSVVINNTVDSKRFDDLTQLITTLGENLMATLADLQAAVAAEDTVIDSAVTLIQGLAAQVATLKNDPAALQALADDMNAKAATLAAAIAAGTPATP